MQCSRTERTLMLCPPRNTAAVAVSRTLPAKARAFADALVTDVACAMIGTSSLHPCPHGSIPMDLSPMDLSPRAIFPCAPTATVQPTTTMSSRHTCSGMQPHPARSGQPLEVADQARSDRQLEAGPRAIGRQGLGWPASCRERETTAVSERERPFPRQRTQCAG